MNSRAPALFLKKTFELTEFLVTFLMGLQAAVPPNFAFFSAPSCHLENLSCICVLYVVSHLFVYGIAFC
jgi:hypothetical protein